MRQRVNEGTKIKEALVYLQRKAKGLSTDTKNGTLEDIAADICVIMVFNNEFTEC